MGTKNYGSYDFTDSTILPSGAIISNWIGYTPTFDMTNCTVSGAFKEEWNSIHVRAWGTFTGAPVGTAQIRYPIIGDISYALDTKFSIANRPSYGSASFFNADTGTWCWGQCSLQSEGIVPFLKGNNVTPNYALQMTATWPVTIAAGDRFFIDVIAPIYRYDISP